MRRYYLIGLTALLLFISGVACRVTLWTRPGSATPTSPIRAASPTPIPSPTAPPTATPPARSPGSGKILYLALQNRMIPASPAATGPGVPPGSGAIPGTPQAAVLIPPVSGAASAALAQPAAPAMPARAALPRPEVYHLQRGEYPYCLARRYDIHPQDLMALNGFSYRQVFYPGQAIHLPRLSRPFPGRRALRTYPATYTVRPGDSLYSIACDFGDLDPQALLQANVLEGPGKLKAGMRLVIPAPGSLGVAAGAVSQPPAPPQAAVPPALQPGPVAGPAAGLVSGPAPAPTPGAASIPPPNRPAASALGHNDLVRVEAAVVSPPATAVMGMAVPWLGLPGRPRVDAPTPAYLPPVAAVPVSLLRFDLTDVPTSTATPTLPPATPLTSTPTAVPPPTALPLPTVPPPPPTPTVTPTPRPTRPVPDFELPQASLDLSQANRDLPADLLPQIDYTLYSGSSLIRCPRPENIAVSANDLSFRLGLPEKTYEINMVLDLYSCGWVPGEEVILEVQYPDGQIYRQEPLRPEDALSRYADGDGRVYRLFRTRLVDRPGSYVFILRGTQSPRVVQYSLIIQSATGPRARTEFKDGDDRTSVAGYTLYGFQANEPVRALIYHVDGLPVRGQLVGWQTLQVDPYGNLSVAIDPTQVNLDYQFIGLQSGPALVSFSRVGRPANLRASAGAPGLAALGPEDGEAASIPLRLLLLGYWPFLGWLAPLAFLLA